MSRWIKKNYKKILLSLVVLFFITGIILYSIPITRYIIRQGYCQAKIILSRRSMDDMLKDPGLDKKTKDKILLVGEIKKFGISLGLNTTDSYKTVYDTGGKPVVWAVSASPKDKLMPVKWKFPVVGEVPYLGYFKKKDALRMRDKLKSKGYDTLTRPVQAYSTIGILPDPLFSSLLFGGEEGLANTILHEMTHETVFVKNDIPFNESMANFVGNVGGVEFLKKKYGQNSKQVRNSLNIKHDDEVFSGFMADLYDELDKFYKSDITKEDKIGDREKIFEKYKDKFRKDLKPRLLTRCFNYFPRLKLNNAYVLYNRRYHKDYNIFYELYELQGRDLKKTISFLKSIKKEKDIKAHIQKEVAELETRREK
ncbi:MAG: aminopeptidase [Candidatus Eremiobacteraeota bacterium]|nr:aminopeptidase [Candidatus Eremiobacteraeota bacterium]